MNVRCYRRRNYLNIATQTNNDSTISIEHNSARYPPYRDHRRIILFMMHVTDARSKAKTRTRAASPRMWLSLGGNARRWWLPAIATAYANPWTFAPTAEHTSNFVSRRGEPSVHRTRLSVCLSRNSARFYCLWNVMHCDVRMYKHSYARWSRSKTITYYLNLITANGALPRLEEIVPFNLRGLPLSETRWKGSPRVRPASRNTRSRELTSRSHSRDRETRKSAKLRFISALIGA